MIAKKVYLGKWQHAKDGQMITTLGITHILNISDSCENYLEETHPNLTYLQVVVADEQDKPIKNVFRECFEFIRSNTEPTNEGLETEIAPVNLSQMAFPNSTSTLLLNFSTHVPELKMNA